MGYSTGEYTNGVKTPDDVVKGYFHPNDATGEGTGLISTPKYSLTKAQIGNIYRNSLNRDADQAGIDYWYNKSATMGGQDVYNEMMRSAKEDWGYQPVAGITYDQAIVAPQKMYTTPDGRTSVDEMFMQTLGRTPTAAEKAQWGDFLTTASPDTIDAKWQSFADAYKDDPNFNNVGWQKAIQLGQAAPLTDQGASMLDPAGKKYDPNFTQEVDAKTMTIEGRIQNLMGRNPDGSYSNPVIQQMADAARAQFAQRGLLNSSMAEQAASEAALSKAIEIAGPDAQTYFKQSNINQDWTNKFAENWQEQQYGLQNMSVKNFYEQGLKQMEIAAQNERWSHEDVTALQTQYNNEWNTYERDYTNQVANINADPTRTDDQKATAIRQQYTLFKQNLVNLNKRYEKRVGWKTEWENTFDDIKEPTTPTTDSTTPTTTVTDGGP